MGMVLNIQNDTKKTNYCIWMPITHRRLRNSNWKKMVEDRFEKKMNI
jgi:hypothetical protein